MGRTDRKPQVGVLLSGGLDSAVLVAHEAQASPDALIQPFYIRVGLAWEDAERALVDRLLQAKAYAGQVLSPIELEVPMTDVYPPSHWAIRGVPPAYDTPDEDVYLAGRNIVLISKAAICCERQGIHRLSIGPLAGNPFPDATPEFFAAMGRALSLGLAHPIEITTPFATLHKADVIRLGVSLGVPFELTLSCMNPQEGRHCGLCSKCRERRDAFDEAGVADPAGYAASSPRARHEDA